MCRPNQSRVRSLHLKLDPFVMKRHLISSPHSLQEWTRDNGSFVMSNHFLSIWFCFKSGFCQERQLQQIHDKLTELTPFSLCPSNCHWPLFTCTVLYAQHYMHSIICTVLYAQYDMHSARNVFTCAISRC